MAVPTNTHEQYKRIATSLGPEDILLGTISCSKARLLISCNNHRLKENAPNGDIYTLELDADSLTSHKLKRSGKPKGFDFHPHGFDLVRQNGKVYLFVVSHNEKENKHSVYKYEVSEQDLAYVTTYEHPLMNSPNTVIALRKGGFYVSIGQGRRGIILLFF